MVTILNKPLIKLHTRKVIPVDMSRNIQVILISLQSSVAQSLGSLGTGRCHGQANEFTSVRLVLSAKWVHSVSDENRSRNEEVQRVFIWAPPATYLVVFCFENRIFGLSLHTLPLFIARIAYDVKS